MQPDGATQAEHSASAARQWAALGGKRAATPAAGDPEPAFPDALSYLWGWFCAISAGIAGNGWGCPVITWEALAAWSALTGAPLAPWEAETLVRLGQRRAAIEDEHAAKQRHKG